MYEICTLFSSFGQKMYGQKELKILPFRFIGSFLFSWFFDISVRAFLYYLVRAPTSNSFFKLFFAHISD